MICKYVYLSLTHAAWVLQRRSDRESRTESTSESWTSLHVVTGHSGKYGEGRGSKDPLCLQQLRASRAMRVLWPQSTKCPALKVTRFANNQSPHYYPFLQVPRRLLCDGRPLRTEGSRWVHTPQCRCWSQASRFTNKRHFPLHRMLQMLFLLS